jgi:YVTN family beta-propeller protein
MSCLHQEAVLDNRYFAQFFRLEFISTQPDGRPEALAPRVCSVFEARAPVQLAGRAVVARWGRVMELASVLLVEGRSPSAVPAQQLETTVFITDSFGGLKNPRCLAYNTTDNTICVDGYSEFGAAINDSTNRRITGISIGADIHAICYHRTNKKVYCANCQSSSVSVIDGATDVALGTIEVGESPVDMARNIGPRRQLRRVRHLGAARLSRWG